jgi:formylglycine-generating enzyme required for sulfatase activity
MNEDPTTSDTLVAFAAKAGAIAADGPGEHSPFTAALLQHLATPGLDIRIAFGQVRDAVMSSTSLRQEPFLYSSLGGQTISIVDAPLPSPAIDLAASDWKSVETSTNIAALEAFGRRYPASFQAELAALRIEELKKAQITANVPSAVRIDPPPIPQTTAVAPPLPSVAPPMSAPVIEAVVAPPVALPPTDPCSGVLTVSSTARCTAPLTTAEERALSPKDSFRECEACPEMVVVPSGSFIMGSPKNERDRDPDESPQHTVTIGQPFAVGKFHVTRDQFAAFIAATNSDAASTCARSVSKQRPARSWQDPGFDQDGSHPVVCVSWNDAKAYVDWIARRTGKPYRLLSETEWEYVARAGSSTRYSYGNDERDICRHANSADQTARIANSAPVSTFAPCRDGFAYTSPVGSFTANGFGLYDMQGNVWQWTQDCYHDAHESPHFQMTP